VRALLRNIQNAPDKTLIVEESEFTINDGHWKPGNFDNAMRQWEVEFDRLSIRHDSPRSENEPITTGQVLAMGPMGWLTLECDYQLRCFTVAVDRSTWARRVLGPVISTSGPLGLISPDGRAAAIVTQDSSGAGSVHLIDMSTGKDRGLAVPVRGDGDGVVWSPDGRQIAFLQMNEIAVPAYPIEDFLPRNATIETQKYPKPGDPNPMVHLAVVDSGGGTTERCSKRRVRAKCGWSMAVSSRCEDRANDKALRTRSLERPAARQRLCAARYRHRYHGVSRRVCRGLRAARRLSLLHLSEPTRPLSISYAVLCLKKKKKINRTSLLTPSTFISLTLSQYLFFYSVFRAVVLVAYKLTLT